MEEYCCVVLMSVFIVLKMSYYDSERTNFCPEPVNTTTYKMKTHGPYEPPVEVVIHHRKEGFLNQNPE